MKKNIKKNNSKKYPMNKANIFILFLQPLLIIFGLMCSIHALVVITRTTNNYKDILEQILVILGLLSLIYYFLIGFKQNHKLLLIPIFINALALILVPAFEFYSGYILLLPIMCFGLIFASIFTLNNKKVYMSLMTLELLLAIAFTIYSCLNNTFSLHTSLANKIGFYACVFSPLILTCTIIVAYLASVYAYQRKLSMK